MKVNDQVMVRRQINSGTLVRIGSVLRMDVDAGTATVHFPIDHSSAVFKVEDLQPTSSRFSGRARVQLNPVSRKS